MRDTIFLIKKSSFKKLNRIYYAHVRCFCVLLILLITSNYIISQNVIYVSKEKPISKVDFNWDSDGDLDVLVIINTVNSLKDKDTSKYIHHDDFKLLDVRGEVNWIDDQSLKRTSHFSANNEIVFLRENTWRAKIQGKKTDLKEKLKLNKKWKSCNFTATYQIGRLETRTITFPLYRNVATIPTEDEIAFDLRFTLLQKKKSESFASLHFTSTISGTKITKIVIRDEETGENIGDEMIAENNTNTGNNLKLKIKLKKLIIRNKTYGIAVTYSNNDVQRPIKIFKSTFSIIPDFEINSISVVEGSKELPVKSNRIKITNNKDLVLRVYTNATDKTEYDLSTLKMNFSIKESTHKGAAPPQGIRVDFSQHGKNGFGELRLNFADAEDGIYTLSVTEGSVRSLNGENIKLTLSDRILIERNTKNIVESLRFQYGDNKYQIGFGLQNEVEEGDVWGFINDDPGSKVFANKTTDPGEIRYLINGELSDFKKGEFAKITLKVSGNEVFQFEFFYADEARIVEIIERIIDDKLRGTRDKKKPAKLEKEKEYIITSVVNEVLEELGEGVSAQKTEQQEEFKEGLKEHVEDYIDKLAHLTKKKAEESGFWDTIGGKIVKGVGGLALRYLGIVMA